MLIVYLNSCDCPKEKNEYLPILDEMIFNASQLCV